MSYYQAQFTNGTLSAPYYGSEPFISGFELELTGDRTFTLSPGSARAFTSDFVISYDPYTVPNLPPKLTVDLNTTGALGCYPTPLANLNITDWTSYGVYLLGDTSNTNPPTVIVATGNNFMLPGYQVWRRVGTIYIAHNTLNLLKLTQAGAGNTRTYNLTDEFGSANYGPASFFLVPLSTGRAPCNPSITTHATFSRGLIAGSTDSYGAISTTDDPISVRLPFTMRSTVPFIQLRDQVTVPVSLDENGNSAVYVTVSGVDTSFNVAFIGWTEDLQLQAI
jgi:hypothetical protein